jgi:hypothetical protein
VTVACCVAFRVHLGVYADVYFVNAAARLTDAIEARLTTRQFSGVRIDPPRAKRHRPADHSTGRLTREEGKEAKPHRLRG